ncbi:DUF4062 domain-containing protein [Acinetobacter rathckeae]|uniref:DUF4062 domain-containing protein n=1 Tax=Acinetobacter rathckeae TaxID=2605272 RepID=UPI0018A2CD25|nr:DUF4062 domain-containing protein [Acinetobacter rathckeae]MBF7696017.1 DUF4062 domain-containing protein [Acinetobacter rathckeae]
MVDKRYQVFISTSGLEMSEAYRTLCQTLVLMGYFPWGVEQRSSKTATLARRQIDESDYVILLLGADYGMLSSAGMSYMQLEYIYALARQKPVIAFVLAEPRKVSHYSQMTAEIQQKFTLFRQQIMHDVPCVLEFEDATDLELKARIHMPEVLLRYPTQGWIRSYGTRLLQDEIQRLRQRVEELESKPKQLCPATMLNLKPVQCTDTFNLQYHLQAYDQNGDQYRLKQVKKLTWLNILHILAQCFATPKSEAQFVYCLNRYLEKVALSDVAISHPNLTEVSEVNITTQSLHSIKVQVQKNAWIVPVGRDHHRYVLWKMTPATLFMLEKICFK